MNLDKSNWKFDALVVPVFDAHVKQSVPMYDEFHSLVIDLSSWFLQDNTNMYDIGASTGTVIRKLMERSNKQVNYIAIDDSKEMCEYLLNLNLMIEVINKDVADLKFENASLITSILTIQFIPKKFRQLIISNIYKGLNKGGAFIFVEKVFGNNSIFQEIWTDLHYEFKLKSGLTEKHIIDKSHSLRGVMSICTMNENTNLLKKAGFNDIDVFFKWNNFVGFIAIK